jgi:hypothetical protein
MARKHGFGLVEILIALCLIALFLPAMSLIIKTSYKAVDRIEGKLSAVYSSAAKMEQLIAMPVLSLEAQDESKFDGGRGLIRVIKLTGGLLLIEVRCGSSPAISTLRAAY